MKRLLILILIVVAGVFLYLNKLSKDAPVYDLVIKNGNAFVDGSKDLQKVNIGINGDSIAEISKYQLYGREIINAKNHIVLPGFIHIEEEDYNPNLHQTFIKNGITTVLYLEDEPKKIVHQPTELNFGFISPALIKDANYADLSQRVDDHKFCKKSNIIYSTEMEKGQFLNNLKKMTDENLLTWEDVSTRCSKNIVELTKKNIPIMKKRGTLKTGNAADILVIPSCCQKTKNPIQLVFINGDLVSKVHLEKPENKKPSH
ncbi:hypothetical protein [Aureivirga marina]|uniref:hypothetical protein n=1 Tax=Aureivirga marina TaxID=1182451 RepID=UPI0018C98641|nr:hypothetical protein [Aureivirga marina]